MRFVPIESDGFAEAQSIARVRWCSFGALARTVTKKVGSRGLSALLSSGVGQVGRWLSFLLYDVLANFSGCTVVRAESYLLPVCAQQRACYRTEVFDSVERVRLSAHNPLQL